MDNERASRLANSFARAKELTDMVSTPEFDKYAKDLIDGGYSEDDSSFIGESFQNQSSYNAQRDLNSIRNRKEVDYTKSKLPKKILDEIRENPLDGLSADPTMDAFTRQLSEKIGSPDRNKKTFSEYRNNTNETASNASKNDYEIIKMIVEGIVKKYVEPLSKQPLNENTSKNTLNTVMIGKKFKFIDGSGNIFEADLKYKGNINDIKNKK